MTVEHPSAVEAEPYKDLTQLGVEPAGVGLPPLRSGVVPRPRLAARLAGAVDSPLVVVTPPAGYGKTIGVNLWAGADPRPVAWVQLGPADDDPVFLLRHIAAAVQTCGTLDAVVVQVLEGPGRPLDTALIPTLGQAIATRPPMVIVLDDAHLVTSDGALGAVQELLKYLPDGSQLVILTRHRPQLQLARRRLDGGVAEIGAKDLVMDRSEARELISAAGLRLSEDEADVLIDRTEGWPAVLGLSVLALQETELGRTGFGVRDAGRPIADYLIDEVLGGVDEEMSEFLLRASLLERMSAPLLEELIGHPAPGLLKRIDRSGNLFIVPLDDRHEWFRFHHLVGDGLRRLMRSERPLEARTMCSRASRVLEAHGDVDGALRQAVAAGESDRAAELALRNSLKLIDDGRVGQLGQWIELIGPDLAERNPSLALARAWFGIGTADPTVIARSIKAAEGLVHDGPLPDGSPSLEVAIAAVRSMVASDGAAVLHNTDIVRNGGDPEINPWWGYATCLAGTVASLEGENARARDLLYAGVPEVTHSPSFEAGFLGVLALIEVDDRDFDQADRHARRALKLCVDHNLEGVSLVLQAYTAGALVAAHLGRAEESRAASLSARRLLAQMGDLSPRSALRGYLALASASLALGDGQAARSFGREALLARRRDPSCSHLNASLDALQTVLGGADGSQRDPMSISTAELRVLAYLPTHLSLGEIAQRVFVSRNTVKTHTAAIYRKLGAVSRAEAVATAVRLGLLGVAGPAFRVDVDGGIGGKPHAPARQPAQGDHISGAAS